MKKILVEISIPIIEKKFDLLIPINIKIGRLIFSINKAVNELTDGKYIIKDNTIICNSFNGEVYDPGLIIKDAGIRNGSKLLII